MPDGAGEVGRGADGVSDGVVGQHVAVAAEAGPQLVLGRPALLGGEGHGRARPHPAHLRRALVHQAHRVPPLPQTAQGTDRPAQRPPLDGSLPRGTNQGLRLGQSNLVSRFDRVGPRRWKGD